jgi:hypothetical protein
MKYEIAEKCYNDFFISNPFYKVSGARSESCWIEIHFKDAKDFPQFKNRL